MQRLVINPTQKQEEVITLTDAQQHYLHRVLRLEAGDRFVAISGEGEGWVAEIQGNHAIAIDILALSLTELPVAVTLMIALPKGNGFDEVVRHCTELGVTTLMPIISTRSLLNPSDKKLERWRRIAEEATEQSERQIVPTITDTIEFTTALEVISSQPANRYICTARGDASHFLNCLETAQDIVIAVGCEGGWTQEEIENAIAQKFQPVSLGRRILRTITAPMIAMSIVAATLEKD